MTLAGNACVDRWEAATVEILPDGGERPHSPYYPVTGLVVRAVSQAGQVSQGYINYHEARSACARAGKRLCALAEWLRACKGPNSAVYYPYGGTTRMPGYCNEGRAVHPVVQLFDASTGIWDTQHMNDPRINQQPDTLSPTGAYTRCRSPDGTADMVGNLHEWIEDDGGTFKGGFYVDAELNGHGCNYTTTLHGPSYHDYSTGFRCCRAPAPP
jgi:formylglycine-generating enzyme required for sulfatase activity